MTYDPQKLEELNWARSLARALGEEWTIELREKPDLLVRDRDGAFGLEVTEVFAGKSRARGGSDLKKNQADTQKIINKMRNEYECIEPEVPLYVELVGDVDESFARPVVEALLDLNPREKPSRHRERCDIHRDDRSLTLYVTRLPDGWKRDGRIRPDWYSASETVGWRDDRHEILQERIQQKSKRLEQYRRNLASVLGLHNLASIDIRLLLVSDHLWASGMVRPSPNVRYKLHGFDRVYFYPFPNAPTLLRDRD